MNNIIEFITTHLYLVWIYLSFTVLLILIHLSRPYLDDRRCKKIIQKNSLTFYKAFSKVGDKHKRKAIFAVYAFCRYADDLVDEYQDENRLNKLEKELTNYVNKKRTPNFMWRALKRHTKDVYQEHHFKAFYDMIEGQRMDLHFTGYETLEDLLRYCYHVAGTVGLMLNPILAGTDEPKLYPFAVHLGHAMQITNILRDIGEDYQQGRIYLPRALMREANYSLNDLENGKINNGLVVLIERLAKVAEKYFDEALKDIALYPKDTAKPLGLSIVFYRAILDAIRDNGYDVFRKRAVVTEAKKEQIMKAFIKSMPQG